MLPNSLPHWCIIDIRSSPNKQVSSPSNTNALQWNPVHCGIPGYEQADQLAKCTRRATINQHPLPGKNHHHQNSAETQKAEGCIPPSWQARPCGFGTIAFRPQQAQRTHAQETKNRSFPNVSLWWGGPDNVHQSCNRHQSERIAQWPSAAPLHQKLYGGLEDLKKTTNFITAAGLVM